MSQQPLTEQQQVAVETLDGDLLLSAGAGTGKTRTLTERFIHIVETGRAAVDEILALTFTEKAAREMKQRIIEQFERLGRDRERRQVETAYIGTIHSFCARVLRENALEAAVDPYFTVLDEAQTAILQGQVYRELLRRAYADNDSRVLGLAAAFGAKELQDTLFALYRRMRTLGKQPGELHTAPPPDLSALAQAAQQAVQRVLDLPRGEVSPSLARVLDDLRARCARIEALLAVRDFAWDAYHEIETLAGRFKGNVGTREQKNLLVAASGRLLEFAAGLLAHGAAAQSEALRHLLAVFDTAYRAAKDEQGQLDFDDLLGRTRDLFGSAATPTPTALRYRRQFKFFLMDEFQDTNRLQWSVVEPIAAPQARFTVGDAKQSIYRFLYADVTLFLERERALERAGGLLPPLARSFRSHPELLNFTNALFRDIWAHDDFPFGELSPGKEFGERAGPRVEVLAVVGASNKDEARQREAQLMARRICQITGLDGSPPLLLTEGGAECAATFRDIMILFRATTDIQLYEDALDDYAIPYYTVRGRGFYRTQEVQDLRNLLAVIENPLDDAALAAVLRSPLVGVSDEALYWLGAPRGRRAADDDAPPPQAAGRIARRLERLETLDSLSTQDRQRLEAFRVLLADLRETAAGERIASLLDQAVRATDYDLKALCQRSGRRRYANIEKLRQIALAFQEQGRFSLRDFLDYLETLEVVAERESEAATEAEDADVVRLMTIHAAKGLEAPIVIVADLAREPNRRGDNAILSDQGELALRLRSPLHDRWVPSPAYEVLEQEEQQADRAEEKRLFYVACTRAKEHLILSGCTLDGAPGELAHPGATKAPADNAATISSPFQGEDQGEGNRSRSLPAPGAPEFADPSPTVQRRALPHGNNRAPARRKAADPDVSYDELSTWSDWIVRFLGLNQTPAAQEQAVRGDGFTVLVRCAVDLAQAPAERPSAPLLTRFRERLRQRRPLPVALIASGSEEQALDRAAREVMNRVVGRPGPGAAHVNVTVTGAVRYLRCPRLYDLTMVQRLPQPDEGGADEDERGIARDREDENARDRGTRLHDLLRRFDFRGDFQAELERLTGGLTPDEQADAVRVLSRLHDSQLWPQVVAADEVVRETPFALACAGGVVRGQIDALLRRGDQWVVVDYKSGSRHDEEYADQVRLYALACRQILRVTPARGLLYYLDSGEMSEVPIDEAALERTAAQLSRTLRGIAAQDFAPRRGEWCAVCDFAGDCQPAAVG